MPRIRKLLEENFRPFGTIDSIYIVHAKTIAFVRCPLQFNCLLCCLLSCGSLEV
jgi:hypothetical protein